MKEAAPETGKKRWLNLRGVVFTLYLLCALYATIPVYILEKRENPAGVPEKMKYGNYIHFKLSWIHLTGGKDLYSLDPAEDFDYFKYSPTFALLFGLIAWMPDLPGLILWSLLNALVLFFAIRALPGLSDRNKQFILLFLLVEMMTSLQNMQSNALIAGLLIFAFVFLEKNRPAPAALFIVLTLFIKLFGAVAFLMFLFYPQKRKLILWSIGWFVILLLLPLPLCGAKYLVSLYQSWFSLLAMDHSASVGFSVMGLFTTWSGIVSGKEVILLAGAVICCLPLLMVRKFRLFDFRLMMLASILIWMVIFNHKAESPTFVIAMSGVALWFFSRTVTPLNTALLLTAFLFTSLSSTDLFPRTIHDKFIEPYAIKAVPCILVWLKILWDLFRLPYGSGLKECSSNPVNIPEK